MIICTQYLYHTNIKILFKIRLELGGRIMFNLLKETLFYVLGVEPTFPTKPTLRNSLPKSVVFDKRNK